MHQHPGFNKDNQANNLGLLELNDTVEFDEFVCSACLPAIPMLDSQISVSGIAFENYDGNNIDYILKYNLTRKPDEECKKFSESRTIDTTNLSCYTHESEQIKKCGVSYLIYRFDYL
jgi:hypothetical protein